MIIQAPETQALFCNTYNPSFLAVNQPAQRKQDKTSGPTSHASCEMTGLCQIPASALLFTNVGGLCNYPVHWDLNSQNQLLALTHKPKSQIKQQKKQRLLACVEQKAAGKGDTPAEESQVIQAGVSTVTAW